MAVTGCYDKMFSPVICNGYPHAVDVRCVFDGGKTASATLPPKTSMPQREDGLLLQTLTISMPGGARLASYAAADFKAKVAQGDTGKFWLVTTNGLTHIPATDFKSWTSSIAEIEEETQ